MNKYNNGKIYTIRCKDDNNLIYVGSTCQALYKRWHEHKKGIDNPNYQNKLLYIKMKEKGVDQFYIELYKEVECENKEQLRKAEGEIIREIGTMNQMVAGRTRHEYNIEEREKIQIYNKNYRETHQEQIKENRKNNKEKLCEYNKNYYKENSTKFQEIITCECGFQLTKGGKLDRHKQSQRHIKLMIEKKNIKI